MAEKAKKQILCGPSEEGLPYSKAVRAGDLVFVSGMVAFGDDGQIVKGGIEVETVKVLEDLNSLMIEIGGSLEDIVKVNICLPDRNNFEAFNQVYRRYFISDHPARATIVAGVNIDAAIELEAIAYMPQS